MKNPGSYYIFEQDKAGVEIGAPILERDAIARVRAGKDVYTPAKADAKALAKDVDPRLPEWDSAGKIGYFSHFHPAGIHPSDGYGHIFYGERGEDAVERSTKTEAARIGPVTIWAAPKEMVLFFKSSLQIDAGGAPEAYHPGKTRGLDNLANAGRPGNWWALVTADGRPTGEPVIQGKDDPAPGFYVSTTALENRSWPRISPRRYIDSSTIPYFVLPGGPAWGKLDKLSPKLGDLGLVINCGSRLSSYAIYADVGPAGQIGEGSIALAKALGANANPRTGGVSSGIFYVVFPGSGDGAPKSAQEINSIGKKYFTAWGGMERLRKWFPDDL